jgi:hypothetical protein
VAHLNRGTLTKGWNRPPDPPSKRVTVFETYYLNDAGLNMTAPSQMRDLANRLVAYEATMSKASEPMESADIRVYEKLRMRLSALAGVAGFQSLALRALTQAKSETPCLWGVEVAADGSLEGLDGSERPVDIDNESGGEVGVVLIGRLLGLLLIFLGETLTLNLISDLWPDAALDDRISRIGRKA